MFWHHPHTQLHINVLEKRREAEQAATNNFSYRIRKAAKLIDTRTPTTGAGPAELVKISLYLDRLWSLRR